MKFSIKIGEEPGVLKSRHEGNTYIPKQEEIFAKDAREGRTSRIEDEFEGDER